MTQSFKVFRTAPLLLFLCSITSAQGDWVQVSEGVHGLFLSMPGQPQKTTFANGLTLEYSEGEGTNRAAMFALFYKTLETTPSDPVAYLREQLNVLMEKRHPMGFAYRLTSVVRRDYEPLRSLKDMREKPPEKYPGFDARCKEVPNPDTKAAIRCFIDGRNKRFAILMYIATPLRFSETEAKRFLDSLWLLH